MVAERHASSLPPWRLGLLLVARSPTPSFLPRRLDHGLGYQVRLLEEVVDERSYALKLLQDITPDKLESWSKGNPVAWANEGYEIATNIIYGKLPHSGTLPESYAAKALPIVNEQLERAGVRLATVVNNCLR
jgi:hypothetical protein